MARASVPHVPARLPHLPRRVAEAAQRFHEERGLIVSEAIGTDDPQLIELFLIAEGYLGGPPEAEEIPPNP